MEKQSSITTYNPENGEKLATYPLHTSAEIDDLLADSLDAYLEWKTTAMPLRVEALKRLADLLLREKESLSLLMTKEMGKTRAEGIAEIEKCASGALYYAEQGPAQLAPIEIKTEAQRSFVCFEPIGPVLAIMPWNFPFWQVVRCAAPSLLVGNTVVLKHASNVMGCALALEKIFAEATKHENFFRTVVVSGQDALPLIARPEIAAVSLTGSTDVGRKVAAAAGQALKKCVLELGGSDAYVVLADADLAKAAKICAQSRLINAGQSCIAAKRFIVEKSVVASFTDLFVKEMRAREIGPMARLDLRDELQKQVDQTVAQGANLLCGGKIPSGKGYHYPATVLSGVRPGMTAFDDELFGPVAAIVEAENEQDAIKLANLSAFGLGAAVFTRDLERAEKIARFGLDAGSCFGNALVRSDPRLPFGGIKQSGFGRELSMFGLREFTNIKTVYIDA